MWLTIHWCPLSEWGCIHVNCYLEDNGIQYVGYEYERAYPIPITPLTEQKIVATSRTLSFRWLQHWHYPYFLSRWSKLRLWVNSIVPAIDNNCCNIKNGWSTINALCTLYLGVATMTLTILSITVGITWILDKWGSTAIQLKKMQ